ncbi:MAG: hypothetical protein O7E52_12045 [Candidatus Poribacteria bacterium]|nr:hypothetical protein [Candidatus Poribacteria bacterium]
MKTYRVAIVGLGCMGSTLDQSIASACRASERLEIAAGAETIPERRTAFVELYNQGKIKLDELISRYRPLDEINAAFDDMNQGKVARTVLVFE